MNKIRWLMLLTALGVAVRVPGAELTPAHWKVIDYCRQWAGANGGKAPTLRTITTNAGVTITPYPMIS